MVKLIFHMIKKFVKNSQQLGNMEFGRRMAMEKDIERNEATFFQNLGSLKIFIFHSLNIFILCFFLSV